MAVLTGVVEQRRGNQLIFREPQGQGVAGHGQRVDNVGKLGRSLAPLSGMAALRKEQSLRCLPKIKARGSFHDLSSQLRDLYEVFIGHGSIHDNSFYGRFIIRSNSIVGSFVCEIKQSLHFRRNVEKDRVKYSLFCHFAKRCKSVYNERK